jgi:hypothetical protein
MAGNVLSTPGYGDSADSLFLRQFAGEVITAFETANIMMPLHTVRTIPQGKSAQFPTIGNTTADYHTPGTDIQIADGQNTTWGEFGHNERLITIDDLLLSSAFVDSLEEAKAHYEYRSVYSQKMGYALAKTADEQLMALVAEGSEMAATDGGANSVAVQAIGGGDIEIAGTTGADSAVTAASLVSMVYDCAVAFDEADVPAEDRHIVLPPQLYYNLISNGSAGWSVATSVANSDIGGSGFQTGTVPMLAGFQIHMSNNLPVTNRAALLGENNDYATTGGTDKLKGIAFQRGAIGTVKLRDLAVESEYQIARQGTLMVAKYAMGHGVLVPAACLKIVNLS